jgi:hypothetical protein
MMSNFDHRAANRRHDVDRRRSCRRGKVT